MENLHYPALPAVFHKVYLPTTNSDSTYADPTDNPDAGTGIIFVGVVAPEAENLSYRPLGSAEGAAIGHLLARSPYKNATPYLYYWGSGWLKGSMPDMDSWVNYLKLFRQRIDNPLKYSVSD